MATGTKKTDEELLQWHDILEDFYTSKMTRQEFCNKNGLLYSEFNMYHSRIFYKSLCNPLAHASLIKHVKSSKFKSMRKREYAATHDIDRSNLTEILRYLDVQKIIQKHRPNSVLTSMVSSIGLNGIPETRKLEINEDAYPAVIPEKKGLEVICGTPIMAPKPSLEIISSSGLKISIPGGTNAGDIAKIITCLNEMHN